MALSNAEKQQRWREKHLGEDGGKAMLQVAVRKTTIAMLHRMARNEETTIANLVETLIRDHNDLVKVEAKKERERAEAKEAREKAKARKPRAKKRREPTAAEHNAAMAEPEAAVM